MSHHVHGAIDTSVNPMRPHYLTLLTPRQTGQVAALILALVVTFVAGLLCGILFKFGMIA